MTDPDVPAMVMVRSWRSSGRVHPALPLLLALLPVAASPVSAAEVQLRCEGTLLEARGSAEQQRPLARIAFTLNLEAEAASADRALGMLQARLAAVRTTLQQLGVEELRVGSPSTWQRSAEPGRPAQVQANLPVSGRLAAARLQGLVRGWAPSPECAWRRSPPRPIQPGRRPPARPCWPRLTATPKPRCGPWLS